MHLRRGHVYRNLGSISHGYMADTGMGSQGWRGHRALTAMQDPLVHVTNFLKSKRGNKGEDLP